MWPSTLLGRVKLMRMNDSNCYALLSFSHPEDITHYLGDRATGATK